MKKLLLIVYFLVAWNECKSVPVYSGNTNGTIVRCECDCLPHQRRCKSQQEAEQLIADLRDEDYLNIGPTNRFDYKILKVEEVK